MDTEKNLHDEHFDRELHAAMRPVNAPETLAKFLALAAEAEARRSQRGGIAFVRLSNGGRVLAFPRAGSHWMGGAVAAMLLAGVFVAGDVHVRREHERATQDFATAERIEAQTLAQTRQQLAKAGVSLEP